jgi:hypothetical protein
MSRSSHPQRPDDYCERIRTPINYGAHPYTFLCHPVLSLTSAFYFQHPVLRNLQYMFFLNVKNLRFQTKKNTIMI